MDIAQEVDERIKMIEQSKKDCCGITSEELSKLSDVQSGLSGLCILLEGHREEGLMLLEPVLKPLVDNMFGILEKIYDRAGDNYVVVN